MLSGLVSHAYVITGLTTLLYIRTLVSLFKYWFLQTQSSRHPIMRFLY
jgi:hypothetical protein